MCFNKVEAITLRVGRNSEESESGQSQEHFTPGPESTVNSDVQKIISRVMPMGIDFIQEEIWRFTLHFVSK